MFSHEELDAMANRAKEQLRTQAVEDQGVDKDLYADIMAEIDGTSSTEDNFTMEEYYREEKVVDYDDIYAPLKNSQEEYEEVPTLNPYDEQLFAGGPTKSQIETWKKEWEGYDIYVTEILNQTFIFRTLNRFEYKQLVTLQNVDALQREEIVCQTVTLWPENYTWREMATTLAGIPSTYAEIVMEKSGFTKDYAIQVI